MELAALATIAHASAHHGIIAYEIWKQHRIAETVAEIAADLKGADKRVLRRAYGHLKAAANASNRKSRRDELRSAREAFAEICARESESHNSLLIALGYYGSFCYFTAIDDFANALCSVYECTEKYPDLALQMFPRDFYSKNYRDEIPRAQEELDRLRAKHARDENELMLRSRTQVTRDIQTSMSRGTPLGPSVVDEADVQGAMRLRQLEGQIIRAEAELKRLRDDLAGECETWLNDLRHDSIGTLQLDHFRKILGPERIKDDSGKISSSGKRTETLSLVSGNTLSHKRRLSGGGVCVIAHISVCMDCSLGIISQADIVKMCCPRVAQKLLRACLIVPTVSYCDQHDVNSYVFHLSQ